jgi:hypothetical protein
MKQQSSSIPHPCPVDEQHTFCTHPAGLQHSAPVWQVSQYGVQEPPLPPVPALPPVPPVPADPTHVPPWHVSLRKQQSSVIPHGWPVLEQQ